MITIYSIVKGISLVFIMLGSCYLIIGNYKYRKVYLIIVLISCIVFSTLTLGEKSIYTKTNSGKKELIHKAELYLNEKLLDKKFNITGINSEGTVDYTILDNNKKIKKEIKYDQYWNAELNDSNSVWFFPVFFK